jgi:rubrerythrin
MAKGSSAYLSLREVIEKAMEFEESSALFYSEMKAGVTDTNVRDLLDSLERQERKHKQILADLLEKETEESYVQFPPELSLLMPAMGKTNPTFEELLDYAIEREIQSALIYETTGITAPARIKSVLSGLAGFERSHEAQLRELKVG